MGVIGNSNPITPVLQLAVFGGKNMGMLLRRRNYIASEEQSTPLNAKIPYDEPSKKSVKQKKESTESKRNVTSRNTKEDVIEEFIEK